MNRHKDGEAMRALLDYLKEKLGSDWEECPPSGIPGLSTNGLKARHNAILDAVAKDDATPLGRDKLYGAREFPDWRQMCIELEDELSRRNEPFRKVPW
jgi:hypothetical protein